MDGIPSSLLAMQPAMLPPPGDVNNFVNPPDLLVLSIVVASVSLAVAVFFYTIRLFVKLFLIKKMYPEDYTCGLSIAVFAALSADVSIAALQGSSRHQWNLNLLQAIPISYTAYWGEVVFCVAICIAKISIIQQIRRIFSGGKKGPLHKTCTLLMWVNGCFYTAASLAGIFSCTPRAAAWDPFVDGKCTNKMMLIVISSGINVLSDIILLVIPMWCVWHLVLPLKKKLPLGAVFLTGIFSLSMAVLKLYITIPLLTTQDLTYTINLTGLSACAETSSAIIVGCLPCLPRFFQFVRNGSTRSSSGGRSPAPWSGLSRRKGSKFTNSTGFSSNATAVDHTTIDLEGIPPKVPAKELSPASPTISPLYKPDVMPRAYARRGEEEDITALPPILTSFPYSQPGRYSHQSPASQHRPSDPTMSPLSDDTAIGDGSGPDMRTAPSLPISVSVTTSTSYEANRGPRGNAPPQWSSWNNTPPTEPPQAYRQGMDELANSPASRRTMNALSSRYWQDLDGQRRGQTDRCTHCGHEVGGNSVIVSSGDPQSRSEGAERPRDAAWQARSARAETRARDQRRSERGPNRY